MINDWFDLASPSERWRQFGLEALSTGFLLSDAA